MPGNGADMDIFCENCQKNVGKIADEKIPVGKKLSVSCPKCGENIHFARPAEMSGAGSAAPSLSGEHITQLELNTQTYPNNEDRIVASDYDIAVIDKIIREAWEKTKGFKRFFWGAAAIFSGLVIILLMVVNIVTGGNSNAFVALFITTLFAIFPIVAGINVIAIRRSVNLPVNYKMAFSYFGYTLPLLIAVILIIIMTYIGFFLFVLPGIYLSVAYALSIPLIVEKNMGPWQAMEASRKAIHKCWFTFFGINFAMGLLVNLSMIPLGVGLIWTMPMLFIVNAILYREIFGVTQQA